MDLHRLETSREFYDRRYTTGYMEDWPADLKARVFQVLRAVPLPTRGTALDFGCGNGVFTKLLEAALPGWEIHGTDISPVALANARRRCHAGTFFLLGDPPPKDQKYDLLFSHHVLEHVGDIEGTWAAMAGLTTASGHMLHILPCGNPGSLEHYLCRLRTDGIDGRRGDRFYFEDEGHLRRLDTAAMVRLAARHDFRLVDASYRNQGLAAIEWMTEGGPRVPLLLTNPAKARGPWSAAKLLLLGSLLVPVSVLRALGGRPRPQSWRGQLRYLAAPLILSGRLLSLLLRRLAAWEWQTRRREPGGSEMFLTFGRASAGGAAQGTDPAPRASSRA